MCKDLFKLISNYENKFGECYNKLRLLLDLAAISYKTSFVFVSDGPFQQKIRTEVLSMAGERAAQDIIARAPFNPPFSLERHPQAHLNKVCILDVVK